MAVSTSPSDRFVAWTKHDTNEFSPPRAVFVGTGGDVVFNNPDGADVTFKNVANGALLPITPNAIRSTGTTAGDFVLLY